MKSDSVEMSDMYTEKLESGELYTLLWSHPNQNLSVLITYVTRGGPS